MVWWTAAALAGTFGGLEDGEDTGRPAIPGFVPPVVDGPSASPVVGGHPVKVGKWDDAVGVVFLSAYVGCTGTLIGPKVVLTAGHCVLGYPVTHVIVGSKDWFDPSQGEAIEVEEAIAYPNSQQSYDVAVLILKEAATYAPREVALECVLDEYLTDAAPVQIVGFGGTRADGQDYQNHELNEVATTVVDKNCSEDSYQGIVSGCQPAARPGGELVAGGGGKDACFGDSGGPLYLKTDAGDYVVGVTSRALLGVPFGEPCYDGGIWVRPDAVFEWIADVTGGKKIALPSCNAAPEASAPEVKARKNHPEAVDVAVTDLDGDASRATVAVGAPPEHGEVTVEGLTVTYTPADEYVGEDSFTLLVTDEGNADYEWTGDPVTTEITVPVRVRSGLFGCASTPAAAGWLALGLLATSARRRR